MIRLLAFFCVLTLGNNLQAQERSVQALFIDNLCTPVYISLTAKTSKKFKENFPFYEIEFADYRTDSVRVGLIKEGQRLTDLRLAGSVTSSLSAYFNGTYANPSATKKLLVVVKDLWFSDIVYPPLVEKTNLRSHAKFRVESYIKDGGQYLPLVNFDTVITSKNDIRVSAVFRLSDLMQAFTDKILALNLEGQDLTSKRHYSFEAIDSFSRRNFNYAIANSATLKKGVYATLEEFRNNRPSVFNYNIATDKHGAMSLELQDEQGKLYFSRRMWGYCDGENMYVMMDGNLFPLVPYGRGFYVYGSKDYMIHKTVVPIFLMSPTAYVGGVMTVAENVTRRLRLFRLDLQTGEIQ